jgi:NCAIR mutase (PurE)-related protein
MPEVIYSAGKTPEQVAEIFERKAERGSNVLATHGNQPKFEAVHARVPQAEFHPVSGCIVLQRNRDKRERGIL